MKFRNIFFRLSLIVFSSLFILSCSEKADDDKIGSYENNILSKEKKWADSIEKESTNFTQEEYQKDFNGIAFGLSSLESHQAFWNQKDTVQFDMYFNDDVTRSQLQAARGFVFKKFILRLESGTDISPYNDWLLENDMIFSDKIQRVICNVYVNDVLKIQDEYNGQKKSIYENMDVEIDKEKYGDYIVTGLNELFAGENIEVEKSLIGYPLVLKVDSKKDIDMDTLLKTETYIKDTLSKAIKEDTDFTDTQSIILILYKDGKKYYESGYNLEKSDWMKDDWMNHDYFTDAS